MSLRLLVAAALTLVVVVVVAAGAVLIGTPSDERPVSVPIPVADGTDYVALGDSFSSGPLIPLMRNDASGCFRSTNNYPAYLADLLDVTTYGDATCAGAVAADLRRSQTVLLGSTRPPPQLSALSEETDVVTLGIGGNEFGLFGSIIGGCSRLAPWRSPGSPCRDGFTDAQGGDTKARDARRIRGPVTRAVREVREAAPDAEILVVGYPRLMPDRGSCQAAGLTAGDAAWARSIQRLLNRSLERAASAEGAAYVDLTDASRGHDVCAGKDAWVNGRLDRIGVALSFHPLRRGMAGVARVVFEAVTGDVAPEVTGDATPPAEAVGTP
ncbi:MAG: SGNH/GDSL hydrolase family protein [Nocardioides sp.]